MLANLRPYERDADRPAALQILRNALTRSDVGYTIHPGEWDWWRFHRDPRKPEPTVLISDRVLVDLEPSDGECSVFGASPDELVAVLQTLGDAVHTCAWVLDGDGPRGDALRERGYVSPADDAGPVYERPVAEPLAVPRLPDGLVVRPVAGLDEAPLRAAAARRAFRSNMPPAMHAARYRSFMQSPGYVRERDLVVFDERAKRIASFAIHWIDDALSLAQLEPVGTDPDYMRRGLGRALMAATFARLREDGIRTVRVLTEWDNEPASALYESCGFTLTARMRWWQRRR